MTTFRERMRRLEALEAEAEAAKDQAAERIAVGPPHWVTLEYLRSLFMHGSLVIGDDGHVAPKYANDSICAAWAAAMNAAQAAGTVIIPITEETIQVARRVVTTPGWCELATHRPDGWAFTPARELSHDLYGKARDAALYLGIALRVAEQQGIPRPQTLAELADWLDWVEGESDATE